MTVPIRVKICCIASVEEAQLAVRAGVSAVGLVSAMPSGPGAIPEERIAEIVSHVPPGVATFLLTCLNDPQAIIVQQRWTKVNTIQLCDRIRPADYAVLRKGMPGVKLVQVIHVTGEQPTEDAIRIGPQVDALLLDSGNPSLTVKELGGTGRIHDWSISENIVKSVSTPVYLAGGLKPENLAEAVRRVRPFGVDVCSGLRTDGKLDERKVTAFFNALTSPQEQASSGASVIRA